VTARALIVEDEPLVAELLEDMLREAGYEIAASVGALDKAMAMLETVTCDFAILDINLRGRSTEPVAAVLRGRGVPFLFVSGYGSAQLSQQFLDAPLLSKPFRDEQLIKAIQAVLGAR
jgi:DNA-binding response OmpR family regulator